jgi:hypothetical protein
LGYCDKCNVKHRNTCAILYWEKLWHRSS